MKRSLATVAGTMTILIGAALFLEHSFRDYKTRVDDLFDHIRDSAGRVDLVLLGNSHVQDLGAAELGRRARLLNLADGGKDIFHDLLLFNDLLSRTPRPRLVIMGVDYDALGFDFNISHQRFIDRQYYPHTGVLYDNSLSNRLMARSIFLRSGRDFRRFDRIKPVPPPEHPALTAETCRKKALEKTRLFFDRKLIPANLALLEQLVGKTQANGIGMVFVTTPKKPCFVANADPENDRISRDALHSFMESPRAREAVYLDYYDDPRFADDDFRDYTHLNMSGTAKLEKVLSDDLQARGLLAP